MRTIGVVTVGRSDYGIYLPILQAIQANPELKLHLMVSGTHLSPEFGRTVTAIEADGFRIGERVEMLVASDTPEAIAKSMGLGMIGFGQAYARFRPDVLLVLGDRFEMYAAAAAALPFKIPVAHIHGGEVTEGAIDEALRHSITKLSHLHFAALPEFAARICRMGEEPWRVKVSGAPSLDKLRTMKLLDRVELESRFRLRLDPTPLLVTYHPVTLEYEQTEWQMKELLEALRVAARPVLFTLPNADTSGRIIMRMIKEFVDAHEYAQVVETLGPQGYFSLMNFVPVMIGNSSSGLIEAPSFGLPAVNIGNRQRGRLRARNVIDVGYTRDEIVAGINEAVSPQFREKLQGLSNPYGNGRAAEMIVRTLEAVPLDDRLIVKRFHDGLQ
jgi:UDP-hydrolysing UDP-N-acetyl-D-glucosamine 2-epimerase